MYSDNSWPPSMVGELVVDEHGQHVGKVTDVVGRPDTLEAEWLVVKTSMFGRRRLVPIAAATEEGGTARIPFSKDDVLSAPVPEVPTSLAPSEQQALLRHYHWAA